MRKAPAASRGPSDRATDDQSGVTPVMLPALLTRTLYLLPPCQAMNL